MNVRLHELAHTRTGDKGDTADISVIAYREADYARLVECLTPRRVADHLCFDGPIERYELPDLLALKFVLRGVLGGGVTGSLALDSHGKALGSLLLDLDLGSPWP